MFFDNHLNVARDVGHPGVNDDAFFALARGNHPAIGGIHRGRE